MGVNRIERVSKFLNYREHRLRSILGGHHLPKDIDKRMKSEIVVFVSNNSILLKALDNEIKRSHMVVFVNSVSAYTLEEMVLPLKPTVLIIDEQTPLLVGVEKELIERGIDCDYYTF